MSEEIWEGPDELRQFLRPIGDLSPHPQNPRRGDIEIVKTSLAAFGQEKPIITDRDNHDLIVAGNHTFYAARSLGWSHVAALEMWADADEGARYLLMDNRTSDNSSYDREELLALLDRYQGETILPTGFTEAEREQLRAELQTEMEAAREFQASRDAEPPPPHAEEGTVVRNLLVLIEDNSTFEKFGTHLKVLQREWGIVGNSEAIAEVVRREVLRLHEQAPPE